MTDVQTDQGPVILNELIHYQDDSIVSRTMIKNTGGSVTVFAFDGGQDLSEHTVPFDALVYVIDGKAEIQIAGSMHRVVAGETIVLPASIPHAVKAVQRFKMMLSMIKS